MRSEEEIKEGLRKIEEIYLKEFGIQSNKDKPLDIDLSAIGVSKAIERIIRATEICTIKWILNEGGGLNIEEWQYKKVKETMKNEIKSYEEHDYPYFIEDFVRCKIIKEDGEDVEVKMPDGFTQWMKKRDLVPEKHMEEVTKKFIESHKNQRK